MSTSVGPLAATLLGLGGEEARERHDAFSSALTGLLAIEPADAADADRRRTALAHGFSYYFWRWDPRASSLYDPVCAALARCTAASPVDLDLLCELVDFLYFLVWCFEPSSTAQCLKLLAPLRDASDAFAGSVPIRAVPPVRTAGPQRIVWLAMYAKGGDAMSVGLRETVPALLRAGHAVAVYAWRFSDEAFLRTLVAHGATCRSFGGGSSMAIVEAIEDCARIDAPTLVVTDMNNAVPTALFSRRIAPVQVLMQAGMPAWPVRGLDGVFNSFGFDPRAAGWGEAVMLAFNPPWSLAALAASVAEADLVAERASLPPGRLVGSYGRFAKVTRPYLEAAERILLACEDVTLVLGGTGDAGEVRAFAAASPVGRRMHVAERFVSGHIWGRLLDVFLDTWPVTGGESCRETLAKGTPVVTHRSEEMPAIGAQRDPALVVEDWDAHVACAVGLLRDPVALAAARLSALRLAERMSDPSTFERRLASDMTTLLEAVSKRRSPLRRAFASAAGLFRSAR